MTEKLTVLVENIPVPPPLSSQPDVRPTPLAALDLPAIPTALHFRRSHFPVPEIDLAARLDVVGAVEAPLTLCVAELSARWDARAVSAVLECAGHRRSELRPETPGVPWGVGAVAEAMWTGVRLRDVLLAAGISPAAVAVAFLGRDRGGHKSGAVNVPFGRAIDIAKALDEDTLLAWAMNGEPVPAAHGGPLRAIVPGHYAVDSVKWLERIIVLEQPFTGPFQTQDYRVQGRELHELPVHALLVRPAAGKDVGRGRRGLSGVAWGGRGGIARVEVDVDGAGWRDAELVTGQQWGRTHWRLPWYARPGSHTIAVRATDASGSAQPDQPLWNELGYANNSVQCVSLVVR
jgi:DMSO/TMAO reductase YedYZ molybdopterin-dependent catalytic subunit